MSNEVVSGGKYSSSSSNNSENNSGNGSSNGIVGFRGAFRFTKNAMISSFASGKKGRGVSTEQWADNKSNLTLLKWFPQPVMGPIKSWALRTTFIAQCHR